MADGGVARALTVPCLRSCQSLLNMQRALTSPNTRVSSSPFSCHGDADNDNAEDDDTDLGRGGQRLGVGEQQRACMGECRLTAKPSPLPLSLANSSSGTDCDLTSSGRSSLALDA
jgi:hypothetical protein